MKKKILLIDESLTVQKVVALTLDKGSYQIIYARNRQEVIKTVVDTPIDLILLSESVTGLSWQSFPKELESWMGKLATPPPVVLITGQDMGEAKHYISVLKKPFSPQSLQIMVEDCLGEPENDETEGVTLDNERTNLMKEDPLQKVFNSTFADEAELMRQTFQEENRSQRAMTDLHKVEHSQSPMKKSMPTTAAELWEGDSASHSEQENLSRVPGAQKENTEDLWGTKNNVSMEKSAMNEEVTPVLGALESMAYKGVLESEVKSSLNNQNLEQMVAKALLELMPPIVEKLVQARLDSLLKEHEEALAS